MNDVAYTVHIFKEDETFVAYVPELDVSSCGATGEQARENIREAVESFLDASARMGTLTDILQEAGYVRLGEAWKPPEFVSLERLTAHVSG